MPLGAHLPTSKGFEAALREAQRLGCDCLQIFSKSPRQWKAAPLDPQKTANFVAAWRESGFSPLVAHDSYLINLAAPGEEMREKSVRAMIDEVERAEMLGCDFLVTHCGAHTGSGEENGLQNLIASLHRVLEATPAARVKIALENTAAPGTCLGGPFEHLARTLQAVASPRLSVCFDTCHALAAGYDISTPEGVESTCREFDEIIGLQNLGVIHLNDSKGACGSRLDRHEHIGQGQIGRDAMRALLCHPGWRDKPFILETPDVETMIETNLQTVRELQNSL